jgi:hypothetical protein
MSSRERDILVDELEKRQAEADAAAQATAETAAREFARTEVGCTSCGDETFLCSLMKTLFINAVYP